MSITADMLAPVTEAINSGLTTVLPVALGIFATMVGIKLVPKVLKRFIG